MPPRFSPRAQHHLDQADAAVQAGDDQGAMDHLIEVLVNGAPQDRAAVMDAARHIYGIQPSQ